MTKKGEKEGQTKGKMNEGSRKCGMQSKSEDAKRQIPWVGCSIFIVHLDVKLRVNHY